MILNAQNNIINEVLKTLDTSIYGATIRDKFFIKIKKGTVNSTIELILKNENDEINEAELFFWLGWFSKEQ